MRSGHPSDVSDPDGFKSITKLSSFTGIAIAAFLSPPLSIHSTQLKLTVFHQHSSCRSTAYLHSEVS
jgi:hypothetical protein